MYRKMKNTPIIDYTTRHSYMHLKQLGNKEKLTSIKIRYSHAEVDRQVAIAH